MDLGGWKLDAWPVPSSPFSAPGHAHSDQEHPSYKLRPSLGFFESLNTKKSFPKCLTGYHHHFLSLPPGFSPMRKYGGGSLGRGETLNWLRVATTAETKLHVASSQHLPVEEKPALNLMWFRAVEDTSTSEMIEMM